MTSRNDTPIVTAMPTPTHAAVIAPRSKNRLIYASPGRRGRGGQRCAGLELPAQRGAGQRAAAEIAGVVAQLVGDPQQPVVLRDPLGAGRGAGLDLPGAHGDHEVADRGVL